MANVGDVFPARNLPGLAENWGRQVESRIELGEASEVQLSQKVDNGLKANSGALSVLGNQINELTERQILTSVLEDAPLIMNGTGLGVIQGLWSPFELETSEPRALTFTMDGSAYVESVTSGAGLIPVLAYQTSDDPNTGYHGADNARGAAAGLYIPGSQQGAGFLRQSSYIRVLPGRYKIWGGFMFEAVEASTAEVGSAISILFISQPNYDINESDIEEYNP